MTVETYNALNKSDPGQLLTYLSGIGNGYGWSNAYLTEWRKTPAMFCEPDKLALNGENFKDILEAEIKRSYHPETEEDKTNNPIELLLLMGLIKTFPCDT
ncbi:hypothetical protein [Pseudomonas mandelii]|uniref:hypothetical protein n=1 Tax=Pseudomonas mandelii TaxID=75612 RepID=UPI003C75B156